MTATLTASFTTGLFGMRRSHSSGHCTPKVALCRFLDCDLDASAQLDGTPLCALHRSLLTSASNRVRAARGEEASPKR